MRGLRGSLPGPWIPPGLLGAPVTHFSWAKASSCTRCSYLRLVSSTRVLSKGALPLPGRACTKASHSAVPRSFSGSIRSSSVVMFCGDQRPCVGHSGAAPSPGGQQASGDRGGCILGIRKRGAVPHTGMKRQAVTKLALCQAPHTISLIFGGHPMRQVTFSLPIHRWGP